MLCHGCGEDKPASEFNVRNASSRGYEPRCRVCNNDTGEWTYAAYANLYRFTRDEEYMIQKLAAKPTLSAALDNLYRRNPRRWHQVLAAATIQRREAAAGA